MISATPTRARLTPGLLACIAILSAGASPDCRGAQAGDASKPNIILILTDDVGLGNIGCCGGAFQTPNIDALAKAGTRFELCYSTPLCGPSRCQTLTGRYPFRTGHNTNGSAAAIAPGREVMIPTVMKGAGYATACVGKWGQLPLGPQEWGFDESMVFKGERYWMERRGGYLLNGKETAADGKYFPDLAHEFVADFIARHRDGPFFLYYPMPHVHSPILRTPASAPGADAERLYADNIAYMDKLVGRLIAELDRLQLRERTLVLFAGDNGTARFGVEAAKVDGKPISGQKGTMLEGGSRVPLVASWPGITPAGRVNRDLIDFSDFFVTFAELGAAKLPEGVRLDGHGFAAQIRGEKGTPREWVYVELGGKSYVRDARFKLTNGGELFDMRNAPFEEIAVAPDSADEPAIAARRRLQAVLDAHPAATRAPAGGKKADRKAKRQRRNKA